MGVRRVTAGCQRCQFRCVHIRCCGNGGLGFRPYGGSLFPGAEKVTKKACSCVRPARWGSGFLRCGIDPGAAPPVCFAAPPLAVFGCAKRSLRSHARINPSAQPSDVARGSRSRAAAELTLILLSGEERVFGFGFVLDSPLTPALSRGRGSRFVCFSKPEFNAVSHVGVLLPNTAISPLSLRERARVRGF
ncbi:Secreted protein [Pseudomonas sp. IT-347P]